MVAQLGNMNCFIRYLINKSMFVIDAPGPISRECMFKRFRFANAFKWISLNFFNEHIDTAQYLFVGFLPKKIIIPGMIRKDEPHSEDGG